jgi:hypothetical protein
MKQTCGNDGHDLILYRVSISKEFNEVLLWFRCDYCSNILVHSHKLLPEIELDITIINERGLHCHIKDSL